MIDVTRPLLVISDTQIPFENPRALDFCKYLRTHFKIPDENILNVGDETDCYHGGQWPKNPDGTLSAMGELAIAREKIKEWAAAFPHMKLAVSNHGLRWLKKAAAAEIPSQLMLAYEKVFEFPSTWKWKQEWRFMELKHPFRMIHGMGYSGVMGHRNAAMDAKMSTVIGHLHSHAGINFIQNNGMADRIWGMNVGCLIDTDAYAFEYDKANRVKPVLSCGIIHDQGKHPSLITLD